MPRPIFHKRVIEYLGLLTVLLVASSCSIPGQAILPATTSNPVRWLVKEGKPAPDFILENLTGEKIDSAQMRGGPVLVHFWASWCQPCRDEVHRLETAARSYRSRGFEILAITNESDRGEVGQFVREQDLSFQILLDPTNTVFDAYRVTGIPTSFFIDADGVIRAYSPGPLTTANLESNLIKILSAR